MKTARNRGAKFGKPDDGGMFSRRAEEAMLDTPEGVATRARVDAATCEFFKHRERHIRQVTLVVLRARQTGD